MPSTYSPNLRIELIASGEQANTWGNTTNNNLGTLIEQAIAGYTTINVTAANVTLTAYDGASDQARNMILSIIGTAGTPRAVYTPAGVTKMYVVLNKADAAITVYCGTIASHGLGVTVPINTAYLVICDGTDIIKVTS